jgi:hypothetical protein
VTDLAQGHLVMWVMRAVLLSHIRGQFNSSAFIRVHRRFFLLWTRVAASVWTWGRQRDGEKKSGNADEIKIQAD